MRTLIITLATLLLVACGEPEWAAPKQLKMEAENDSVLWVLRDGKEMQFRMKPQAWANVPNFLESWMKYWEKGQGRTTELNILSLEDVTGDGQTDTLMAEAQIQGYSCLVQHRIESGGRIIWQDTFRLEREDIRNWLSSAGLEQALGPYGMLFWAWEHRQFTRPWQEQMELLRETHSPLFAEPADSTYWVNTLPGFQGAALDALDGRALIWHQQKQEFQVYYSE